MKKEYIVILLKELVVLPKQEVKIELLSDVTKYIVDEALKDKENKVLVVAPINQKETAPNVDDLPKVGVVATIKNKLELSNGTYRISLRGIHRVSVERYFYNKNDKQALRANTELLTLPKFNAREESAAKRKLKSAIKTYVKNNDDVSNEIVGTLEKLDDLDKMTDAITAFLPFNTTKKLEYMQLINPLTRCKSLLLDIEEELEILKIEDEIENNLKEKIIKREKEYFLRERLEEIKAELGEVDFKEEEIKSFESRLKTLKLNSKTEKKLLGEIKKYSYFKEDSQDAIVTKNYIETVLSLPWNKSKKENLDIKAIDKVLTDSHYGLFEVKERIKDYVEIKKISKNTLSPIICLVGPPGVGKTSIARSVATALGRDFIKIAVGGLNDSYELIGNRKTYLGSSPGKIIQGIKKCESNNPVILIDEIDKMVKDYKGDPASILLEVLDPEQNNMFSDNYIEEPFDLSNVLFILTANNESDIPYALHDRLEVININSYTVYEKVDIAKKYLIPSILKEYAISDMKLSITTETLLLIINHYTKEAGVRELDRVMHKVIRKLIINNEKTISSKNIINILGNYKYKESVLDLTGDIGITNALAYTSIGGMVTKIEVCKYKGTGNVVITGMLGDSMRESVKVAYSYIKSNYKNEIKNSDVHIHFLEASLKKDGPSSGVSVTSAILSLFLNKKIPSNVAFTGEISLTGNILKVGGLKEKVIAAINSNIKTIYLPLENENDIVEVPAKYLKDIKLRFVKNYSEIYNDIFA